MTNHEREQIWCARNSNPGPQDGGRIRIHCAGFSLFLVIQVSISCICKSLSLLFSAFYYFLALNYLSFPLRQAFPIRFTFAPFAPLSVHLTYTPHFMYFYFCFLQSSSARLSLQDVFHLWNTRQRFKNLKAFRLSLFFKISAQIWLPLSGEVFVARMVE